MTPEKAHVIGRVDGRLHASGPGFRVVCTEAALPHLQAALDYAARLPESSEPVPPALDHQPSSGHEAQGEGAPPLAESLPPVRREASKGKGIMALVRDILSHRMLNITELCVEPKVIAATEGQEPDRRKATVLASLTRLIRANEVINVGDKYKVNHAKATSD